MSKKNKQQKKRLKKYKPRVSFAKGGKNTTNLNDPNFVATPNDISDKINKPNREQPVSVGGVGGDNQNRYDDEYRDGRGYGDDYGGGNDSGGGYGGGYGGGSVSYHCCYLISLYMCC